MPINADTAAAFSQTPFSEFDNKRSRKGEFKRAEAAYAIGFKTKKKKENPLQIMQGN